MYSVWNPVLSTFLAKSISPCENPLAFFTDIVVSADVTEPVIVVELATHNCPPTAFTDSFSNVVVLNVPLIRTFSNSAVPFPSDEIFHPFNPLAKSLVCKIPWGFIIRLPPSIEPVVISHPPIDADTNLAKPPASIEDEAFACVDGLPLITAGVRILSVVKLPKIVASAPIVKLPAPLFALGSKWNKDELISMLPPEPLINWLPGVPIKNFSAFISNVPLPDVVKIRWLLSLSPMNCIPTPSSWSTPTAKFPLPEYIMNPPGPFPNEADVSPSNPTDLTKPLLAPPSSIPLPNAFDIKIEPVINEPLPPMNVFAAGNTTSSININVLEITDSEFKNSILIVFGSPIWFVGIKTSYVIFSVPFTVVDDNISKSLGTPLDFIEVCIVTTSPIEGFNDGIVKLPIEFKFSVVEFDADEKYSTCAGTSA